MNEGFSTVVNFLEICSERIISFVSHVGLVSGLFFEVRKSIRIYGFSFDILKGNPFSIVNCLGFGKDCTVSFVRYCGRSIERNRTTAKAEVLPEDSQFV